MKKIFYTFLVLGILCGVNVPTIIASTPAPIEIAAPQSDDWNDNSSDDGWNDNSSDDSWNDNSSNDDWNDNSSDDSWNDNSSNDSWNDNSSDDNRDGYESEKSKSQSSDNSSGFFNGIGNFFSSIVGIILLIALLPVIIIIVIIVSIKSKIEERREARKAKKEGKTETKEQQVAQAAAVSSAVADSTTEKNNNGSSQYKVRVKGVVHGPYTYDQMCNFIQEGRMNLNTEVMKRGDNTWKAASAFNELASLIQSESPATANRSNAFSTNSGDQYKVRVKGQVHGPYTYEQMCNFIQEGRINLNTEVMKRGDNTWESASKFNELASLIRSNNSSSKSDEDQYKVRVNGQIHGPYTYSEMRNFAKNGKLKESTQVMKKGDKGWKNASEYDEFNRYF